MSESPDSRTISNYDYFNFETLSGMVKTSNNMTIIQQINNITDGEKRYDLFFMEKKTCFQMISNISLIILLQVKFSFKEKSRRRTC